MVFPLGGVGDRDHMGLRSIIADRDFRRVAASVRDIWRGWSEADKAMLERKLRDPGGHWSGGILKLTARECRALVELNQRAARGAVASPLLVWVEGLGLRQMVRRS